MGKLNKNQTGMATLEAVLIAVIVVLIAGVGYYVYHTNKTANNTLNSANQVSSSHTPSFSKPTTSAADTQAANQLKAVQTTLEAYFTSNSYYPSTLSPGLLITQNVSGVTAATFTAPAGTKFIYTPTPNSCSTASKNCKHYTLEAVETGGKVVSTLKSLY